MTRYAIFSLFAAAALSLAAPSFAHAQEVSQMSQLPTPTESGFAEVNDVKIWYQTYGEGDPLILLHGGFGVVEMFGTNIEALAQGRKVIGVDLQAHGGTGPLGRPMSFEAMATDIAELIKSLGYERADVMGYSLGGAVAMRVAIDHPEVVDRLVTVSAAYAYSNWHDYNFEGMKAINADPEATAQSLIGTPQHEGYVAKAPGGEESWLDAVNEFGAFIGTDYDWSAEVPNITAPTLVIVADWDAVRISAATKLFEMLGGGAQDAQWDRSGMGQNHFAVIPNTTHYDIINTTAISELAIPFLDGYAAAE
ncbi:MAG: alpha/beta hydrolase [Rhizobiaceae bacterium]|nr:alpha/beta hydrolase [Rhizobiaceae bacterium]